MVEEIYEIKNDFLQKMRQEIDERGIERVDVGEMYKLADIVKDLAEAEKSCWEAEYYRGVSEAMEGQSGYAGSGYPGGQGGNQGGGQGGGQGGSGYAMGYPQGRSGGSSGGRSSGYPNRGGGGGRRSSRRGYAMGYPMEDLKMQMQQADPQERERMVQELRQLVGGQM